MLKHHTSLKHPFSSHPPKIQATPSTSVTLCALTLCVGSAPYTGALLQYINVAGTGSALPAGRCGLCLYLGPVGCAPPCAGLLADCPAPPVTPSRIVAAPGDLDRPFPFAAVAEEDTTPVADAVSLALSLSLSLSLRSDELDTRRPERFLARPWREDEDGGGGGGMAVAEARLARLLVLACARNVDAELDRAGCAYSPLLLLLLLRPVGVTDGEPARPVLLLCWCWCWCC